ncbi:tRNA (adenosine(37)-N6)-dimethylallyltransferase MiaA [Candidatus Gracilibacteria bacterium]|nr:tRNA (adenosine(37)-N6)-dimethylallyltransferase MiaA [Candidatus Gracilibacteria bacterium]
MSYIQELQDFLKHKSNKRKCIVIYGPTGSGKTDMSIEIAKFLETEIISTDSRQIFKYMNIGTGKITQEEMQGVQHHMMDVVTPNQSFSMGDFVRASQVVMNELWEDDKVPMLVGGTGLYIDSLIFERNAAEVGSDSELRKQLDVLSNEELYQKLIEIDPEYAAELHMNNRPYVERGIEIMTMTGKSKREFRAEKKLLYDVLFLTPDYGDRANLYNRINTRVEMMFDAGAEDEVKSLLEKGYNFSDFGMNSIGYREFEGYFTGDIKKEEVIDKIQKNSRNYAKRQCTWFRKYEAYKNIK